MDPPLRIVGLIRIRKVDDLLRVERALRFRDGVEHDVKTKHAILHAGPVELALGLVVGPVLEGMVRDGRPAVAGVGR